MRAQCKKKLRNTFQRPFAASRTAGWGRERRADLAFMQAVRAASDGLERSLPPPVTFLPESARLRRIAQDQAARVERRADFSERWPSNARSSGRRAGRGRSRERKSAFRARRADAQRRPYNAKALRRVELGRRYGSAGQRAQAPQPSSQAGCSPASGSGPHAFVASVKSAARVPNSPTASSPLFECAPTPFSSASARAGSRAVSQ